jgi:hypothetical protein
MRHFGHAADSAGRSRRGARRQRGTWMQWCRTVSTSESSPATWSRWSEVLRRHGVNETEGLAIFGGFGTVVAKCISVENHGSDGSQSRSVVAGYQNYPIRDCVSSADLLLLGGGNVRGLRFKQVTARYAEPLRQFGQDRR